MSNHKIGTGEEWLTTASPNPKARQKTAALEHLDQLDPQAANDLALVHINPAAAWFSPTCER